MAVATTLTIKKLAAMGFACTMAGGTVGVVASNPIKRAIHRPAHKPVRHHARPHATPAPRPAPAVPYCIPAPSLAPLALDTDGVSFTLPDAPRGQARSYGGGGGYGPIVTPGAVGGTRPDAPPVVTAPASPVPEAATWATLTVGFGVMGATLRRRRGTGALA